MVKNLPSNAGDMGLAPGQRTKIPHATGQLSLCVAMKSWNAAMKTQRSQNKLNKVYLFYFMIKNKNLSFILNPAS